MLASGAAFGDPVTLSGITFSDELGGFRILQGSGTGSADDPFVVVEEIFDDEPAVLVIRGLSASFGNPVRSNHFAGFALTKIAINRTSQVWQEFSMELQEVRGQESDYHDGLSFGQDAGGPRLLGSDRFTAVAGTDEPFDGVVFGGGSVASGQQVSLRVIVTDNSPRPEFYLVQRRRLGVAASGPAEDAGG
ncbi:MAG: hypothetical protein H6842_02540 [Rhodospirillaceae bacterium]|nr:hypothetical protein [Rhodospirillaceae bacterium]